MLRRSIYITALLFLTFINVPAFALLNIELTRWANDAIPVGVVPFSGQGTDINDPNNLAQVINTDLEHSGRFKMLPFSVMSQSPHTPEQVDVSYWRGKNINDVVVGQVTSIGGGRYQVKAALVNLFANQQSTDRILFNEQFTVTNNDLRALAHHISDMVFEKLLGIKGIFSTQIAYILVQHAGATRRFSLEVADADGYNPKTLLTSPEPIMSPAWSPDGRKIAYVSFENNYPRIFVQEVATGQRQVLSHFPGINGAPAWSPDGRQLAVVLSKSGHPKIYIASLQDHSFRQVTQGFSIDTEPSWSSDGRSLIFTSDRSGGSPQIYQVNVATGETQRLTYAGSYNARGLYTPDNKSIVMLHRNESNEFDIALQELQSGAFVQLTRAGLEESPSISPNGKMILYAYTHGGRNVLGMVSTDGRIKLSLPSPQGDVQSPAWSPFVS